VHPRVRLALLAVGSIVLVAALVIALVGPSSSDRTTNGFEGALRSPEIPITDFALHDENGALTRSSALRGEVTVVTFLYTTCRDTCPLVAQTIAGGLDRLGHDVPVLAVSVDPANDTPELARRFLRSRQLQRRMRFLLGSRAELEPIWTAYGIRPQSDGLEHSSYVILLDRTGHQRVAFPADRLTPDGLAHDVRALEAEPASGAS
jgi:protein SCO1/2